MNEIFSVILGVSEIIKIFSFEVNSNKYDGRKRRAGKRGISNMF